ncbi:MAG: hypothetical protein ACJ8EL_03360 [Rhizomicrobium sp.]
MEAPATQSPYEDLLYDVREILIARDMTDETAEECAVRLIRRVMSLNIVVDAHQSLGQAAREFEGFIRYTVENRQGIGRFLRNVTPKHRVESGVGEYP